MTELFDRYLANMDDNDISNLKGWRYLVRDESITLPYLNRFWDLLIENFVPESVSPNLLTLCGLCVTLITWILVEAMYADWMILPIIVSYWISSTIDGIDGKQARRTLRATALGELFDHTVDLVTLFVITRISFHVFGVLHIDPVPVFTLVGIAFCGSHYFACVTGCLYIGRYTGPNECLLGISGLYLLKYFVDLGGIASYLTCFEVFLTFVSVSVLSFVTVFVSIRSLFIFVNFDRCENVTIHSIRFYDISMGPLLVFYFVCLLTHVFSEDSRLHVIQVICFSLTMNCELIVTKMAKMKFRLEAFLICIGCFAHWSLAVVFATYFVLKTMYVIKTRLDLNWLI